MEEDAKRQAQEEEFEEQAAHEAFETKKAAARAKIRAKEILDEQAKEQKE